MRENSPLSFLAMKTKKHFPFLIKKVMYKDVLRHIEDIATFPVISFVIFFVFFISVVVYAWGITKPTINEMENIPLKD